MKRTDAPISKASVPLNLGGVESKGKTQVKKSDSSGGPKLPKNGKQAKTLAVHTRAVINLKAAFKSIGSSKTFDQLKSKLTASALDRRDQHLKAHSKVDVVKGQSTPTFSELQKAKLFPFPIGSEDFSAAGRILMSVKLDVFIAEAREQGHTTKNDIVRFISGKLSPLYSFIGLSEVAAFKRDALLSIADEFRAGGRGLKAELVEDIVAELDMISLRAGSEDRFKDAAIKGVNDQIAVVIRDPHGSESFMRAAESIPSGIIFSAYGMKDFAEFARSLRPGLSSIQGFSELPEGLYVRGLGFTADHVEVLGKALNKVLEDLEAYTPPQDLKDKVAEYAQLIRDQVKNDGLSPAQGRALVYKFYGNAVILRALSPSFSTQIDTKSEGLKSPLFQLTQLMQAIVNGNTAGNFKEAATGKKFEAIAPPRARHELARVEGHQRAAMGAH